MKKYNFSPGPAKLDNSILERVNEDILEYRDTGVSILEISHRSENFQDILNKTKSNLSDLFNFNSTNFNENLKDILENFDKIRQKKLDYQKRFKERVNASFSFG